ncbi:TetR/AcrR family transcriptional regulator [Kribbella ginsengisoli]|uniref:TetR/AcrR family transcriptional regulator n=2 Tax=Kribbella ginsengisoli TaxID=363865 RepID=A0ABP6YMG4_9ACTN
MIYCQARESVYPQMSPATGPGPRERLLDATRRLTYDKGVGIGMDAILSEADVARRSLYQHFGGKDGLVAETLRTTRTADLERYRAILDSAGDDPRERLLALFDFFTQDTGNRGFRGCRYTAADLALPDPAHPAHAETSQYYEHINELLLTELQALGHPEAQQAADQIQLVIDGALIERATRPGARPAAAAARLLRHLVDDWRQGPN